MFSFFILAVATALSPNRVIALANDKTETESTLRFTDGKTVQFMKVGGCSMAQEPGAGMDASDHSTRVYKDGYYHVNCMHDNMEMVADHHGDNRHSYQITTNVSIIRYTDAVERDSRAKMTPRVCFDFCRTVPDMLFFGLANGRDCYCTPYYTKAPGDGVCDLPCEGDSAKTCGGKTMMNVYEMHMCADTAAEMGKALAAANAVYVETQRQSDYGLWAAHQMERTANKLMYVSNEGGDMTTHDYGQQIKVYAGKVLHAAEDAYACNQKLMDVILTGHGMTGNDFGIPEHIYAAEQNQRDAAAQAAECKEVAKAAHKFNEAVFPKLHAEDLETGGSRLFEPIMRSVDRWDKAETADISTSAGKQTTCGGALAAEPIIGLSVTECAEACNINAPASADDFCVAFNHYELTFMAGSVDLSDEFARGWYGPLADHDHWYFGQMDEVGEGGVDMTTYSFFDFFDFFDFFFFSDSFSGGYSYSWGWWYYYWADWFYYYGGSYWWYYGDYYYFQNYYYFYYYWEASDYYYYSEADSATGSAEVYVYPICLLLKEVEHVYNYNCDYGEEWKTCEDTENWHEDGYPTYNCEWYAYNLDYCHKEYYVGWDGEYAHSGCCACGGGFETVSLVKTNSTQTETETNATETPANVTSTEPAFLAKHRHLQKREELREEFELKQSNQLKKKANPFTNDLPLPLVQNKCMTRMSWASAGHQDTPTDTIDRCFGKQMEGTEIDVLNTAADQ